jgi:NTP pyrophosphatase (non-canonical NTP hydrolase)
MVSAVMAKLLLLPINHLSGKYLNPYRLVFIRRFLPEKTTSRIFMSPTSRRSNLSLNEYQLRAAYTDQFSKGDDPISQLRYGLFGEVGGLLSAVKKYHRENSLSRSRQESAEEELGDALWYLATIVRRSGLTFDQVGEEAIVQLQKRFGLEKVRRTVRRTTFSQIDGLIEFQREHIPENFASLLYELAARTGEVFANSQPNVGQLAGPSAVVLYGQLLELLALVAATFELRVSDVAAANLSKIESRWKPDGATYPKLFDDDLDEFERLPRGLEIDFIERKVRGRVVVVQRWRNVNIGDPLTDNRTEPDFYRYHDVFHLAYVALLGWSPVIRGLLKLKRKSKPSIDENQDGARAMIIEEGIATWIFNHARDKGEFFEGVEEGKLEYGLLKQISTMVSGYEVEKCPLWLWEHAILSGFSVFRQLRDNRGGTVVVSMLDRSITYLPLENKSEC